LVAVNKENESVNLEATPFILPYPKYPAETSISESVIFDKGNSNIVNFISLPPTQKIVFSGKIETNPEGSPSLNNQNHFDMDGEISFGLDMLIPFDFKATNLTVIDTVDFDTEILNELVSCDLLIETQNELPFGVDIQLQFMNKASGTYYGDPIQIEFTKPAQVDELGNVTQSTITNTTVPLSEQLLTEIKNADGILMKAKIYTPKDGKPAKVNSKNQVILKLGAKAKINLYNN